MSKPLPTDTVPEEVVQAARWWRNQVAKAAGVTKERADIFFESLVRLIANSVRGHWYEDEPLRGQAFRYLLFSSNYS